MQYLIGVDEVGRGPIAGPVAVGAVLVKIKDIDPLGELCNDFKDSKKLSEKKREEWLGRINKYAKDNLLRYTVSLVDGEYIDRHGIVPAITHAAANCLSHFDVNPAECRVLLDRGIHVPPEYTTSESITKGDETELVIALASIVAKVTRDKEMIAYGEQFPEYGLSQHKGYGTQAHYEAIKKHGKLAIHRRSFLKGK